MFFNWQITNLIDDISVNYMVFGQVSSHIYIDYLNILAALTKFINNSFFTCIDR